MKRFLLALAFTTTAVFSPVLAAPDFPNSPTVGQSYEYLSRTYVYNGEIWTAGGALGPGILQEVITADDATHAAPSGARYVIVECVGAGGGGGSVDALDTNLRNGGGGGGGSYSSVLVLAAEWGASQNIDIGAKGTGGTSATNDASAGADTTVGSFCTGKGGSAGSYGASGFIGHGGAGGVAGTGDVTVPGEAGDIGQFNNTTSIYTPRGAGGASGHGSPGAPVATTSNFTTAAYAGNDAAGCGGGGSGGVAIYTNTDTTGGDGADGCVILTWYLGESFGTDSNLPAGSFVWYTGSTCPSNMLLANGANVSKTTYNRLWAAISGDAVTTGEDDADYHDTEDGNFDLMDLTTDDHFIRAGTYGAEQGDQLQEHTHSSTQVTDAAVQAGSGYFRSYISGSYTGTTGTTGDFGTETRPVNVAMTPCIVF